MSIQPMIITPDLDRLLAFYTGLLGATQTSRVPEDGPVFFVALQVGGSELGLVADADVALGTPQRMLLSISVEDVDAVLSQVESLGGEAPGPSNDMPWGERVAHVKDPDGNALNLTQPI